MGETDYLADMVAESFSWPVRLHVILNGDAELPEQTPDDIEVVRPAANLGVAASWNSVIRSDPRAPYWLIANVDAELHAEDIAYVIDECNKGGARWVGIGGDWRLFGITAEAVDTVGFWDENFHPIYLEDCDMEYRCKLAGVPAYNYHPTRSRHEGGTSWKGIRELDRKVVNEYYAEKWGGGWRGGETYSTPFNAGGSVRDWTLRLSQLRRGLWL
jgi:GT2 family glycosyltransferase